MKTLFNIAALATLLVAGNSPAQPPGDLPPAKGQRLFLEAGQAYDQGRLDDSIRQYEELRGVGLRFPELFFNLGNARFRHGDLGQAIANYRRAWVLHPRDPDVRANLRYALQTAGVPEPADRRMQRWLFRVSRNEWRAIAVTAWWLAAALAGLYFWTRARPGWLWRLIGALVVVLLVAAAGAFEWDRLCGAPEVVVLGKGREALFAPLEGSTAHFALPEGSIGRVVEKSGNWVKLTCGSQEGWVPASACLPVCYWLARDGRFAGQ